VSRIKQVVACGNRIVIRYTAAGEVFVYRAEGVGVIPWSPLARGRLARPLQAEKTKRFETDGFGKSLYAKTEAMDRPDVD